MGFIDAEGFFSIHFHKRNKNYSFTFGIRVNLREEPILKTIQKTFGVGTIYFDKKDHTCRLIVGNKKDLGLIIKILDNCKLKSNKLRDFLIFKRGFEGERSGQEKHSSLLRLLRGRPFPNNYLLNVDWLLGFMEGDGSFQVNIRENSHRLKRSGLPVIHCSLNIMQKEKGILVKIQEMVKVGKITKKRLAYSYDVGKRKDLKIWIAFLEQSLVGFQSPGKKLDFLIWKEVLDSMEKGWHLTKEGVDAIKLQKARMHSYKKID